MRWVKASERLPEKYKAVIVRNFVSNEVSKEVYMGDLPLEKKSYCFGVANSRFYYTETEWLDEQPSPGLREVIEPKFFAVEFAGYWQIRTEPFYDMGKDILNAEDVGEKDAASNAELITKLLNNNHGNS